MKSRFKLYGEFQKVEKQDDGSILVSGVASSETVDADGEIITAEAMKAAMPDYMKFGAVREMHQPIAAGTALKCEVDDTGVTHLKAKIVDPTTCMKIDEEVLKGFSVGGKITSRDPLNKSIITGIRLTEISVVDRPANPDAVFKLGKVDGVDDSTLGELRKSMYGVSDLADLCQRLCWIACDAQCEADYEGDNSPVPAALTAACAQLCEALQEMTAEECAEMLACMPMASATEQGMAMAAKFTKGAAVLDLSKAGKKFSKASAEALSTVHKMLQDCDKAMGAMGYDNAANVQEDEEDAAKVTASIQVADLPEVKEALGKAAGLEDELTKVQGERDQLQKRVTELEALPEASKGVAVVVDADKQAEMFHKQAQDDKAADLKKYQDATDPEEKYKASIKFTHRWGQKPE